MLSSGGGLEERSPPANGPPGPPDSARDARNDRAERRFLVVVALGGLALGITAPVLVLFASSLGAGPALAGLVFSSVSISMLTVDLLGSEFVPHLDARQAIGASLVIVCAGSVVTAAAPNLFVIVVGQMIEGVGAALFLGAALQAAVRLAPPGGTGKALGTFAATMAAGTGTGPFLGGMLAEIGEGQTSYRIAYLAGGFACAGTAVVSQLVLPRMPSGRTLSIQLPRRPSARTGLRMWPALVLGGALYALRGGVVGTVIPLLGRESLDLETSTIGVAFTALAAANVAATRLGGTLADRAGRRTVLVAGLMLTAVACVAAAAIGGAAGFAAWCAALGGAVGLMTAVPPAMIVDVSRDTDRGLAAYRVASDLGIASGAPVAGILVSSAGEVGALAAVGAMLGLCAAWALRLPEAAASATHPPRPPPML